MLLLNILLLITFPDAFEAVYTIAQTATKRMLYKPI